MIPVTFDTRMEIEVIVKPLSTVRNKKKELKDLITTAWQSDTKNNSPMWREV